MRDDGRWDRVWLAVALASATTNAIPLVSTTSRTLASARPILMTVVFHVALLLAVVVSQSRFAVLRAAVTLATAIVLSRLLISGYAMFIAGAGQALFRPSVITISGMVTGLAFCGLTIVAAYRLSVSRFGWAAFLSATVALGLTAFSMLGGSVGPGFDLGSVQTIGMVVSQTIALDAAVMFASVWVGTLCSRLLPPIGSRRGQTDSVTAGLEASGWQPVVSNKGFDRDSRDQ